MDTTEQKWYQEKVGIPILICVLTLVGVFSGSFLTGKQAADQAEREAGIALEQLVLQRRMDLVDRAASIFAKSPGIQDISESWIQKRVDPKVKNSESTLALARQLADYNGEFEAVMFLTPTLFGPKTAKAVNQLNRKNSPWWEKDRELQRQLVAAMASEQYYGLKRIPGLLVAR